MRHLAALLAHRRTVAQCQGVSLRTLNESKFALLSLLALLFFMPAELTSAQNSSRAADRAAATALADPDAKKDASRSPGWVVLPIDEYRSLRARAFPAEHEPEPPPLDATLTRVDYDLRVNGDFASGHAVLTIDILKDGWVRVPIPSGLLVREARLDGKPVSLVAGIAGKAGSLAAILYHPGRSVLTLDIALPINANAGEESFALPSSSSGVTR